MGGGEGEGSIHAYFCCFLNYKHTLAINDIILRQCALYAFLDLCVQDSVVVNKADFAASYHQRHSLGLCLCLGNVKGLGIPFFFYIKIDF